ncbi:MAG: exodeoxyribonuclease V subunit beta [Zoogloeaceae bacterium]|jgi:exodeoxyribonuclease V beta subunit|nr:exodeoxyribonuclease V subunit beta [Zoogloeaceae bacterium]
MSAMIRELELLNCPLTGRVLIEASAGTGKTWSICALIVRLVLEKPLEIRKILVLTFTRAACAELKSRIRARLEEALHFLQNAGNASEPSTDPLLAALFEKLDQSGESREKMGIRLRQALSAFDEAAVFTLHGFCQRALVDTPLLARQPFRMNFNEEGEAGSRPLIEVTADFWRRRVLFGEEPAFFLRWLGQRKFSPESLQGLALQHLRHPLALARWSATLEQDAANAPDEAELQAAFAEAAALWQAEQEAIVALLAEKIAASSLHAHIYRAEILPLWQDAWTRYFALNQPDQTYEAMKAFSASYLAKKTKKGGDIPEHPFFHLVDTLCIWAKTCQRFCEARLARLQRDYLAFFPAALAELKRRQRHFDFNDMLQNVHQALQGESGKALAERLREMYPVALIDEFQDTDPLQYAIFEAIYADEPAGSGLFFVGDPKQAIYSFRQADLPTYFAARKTVEPEQTFGLNHNQRSVEGVLKGINALFSAQENPFMLEELDFPPAMRGAKPLPSFHDESEPARPAFCFWQPPESYSEEKDAARWAISATAAEVARLISASRAGKIRVNDKPLEARRIAILVRTNREGRQIRQALAEAGVRAVELSLKSVYASEVATDLASILAALLVPRDTRRIKAALATCLFGLAAPEIAGLTEAELAQHMTRFAKAHRLWREKGILAALSDLEATGKLCARLLALPGGERALTDYLHLQELLHAEETGDKLTPERLFEVYSLALANPPGGEATQIRLESGYDLVRIVTIHKAKGLEYDIVFCPFLWKDHRPPPNSLAGQVYHDPEANGISIIDYRPENRESGKQLARREQAEESLRLIYVALTRAVLRCYLVCNPLPDEPDDSLLNWLVAGENCTPQDWLNGDKKLPNEELICLAWQHVAEAAGGTVETPSIPEQDLGRADATASPIILPAAFPAHSLRSGWRLESFSGLIRGASWSEEAKEHDAVASSFAPEQGTFQDALPEHDILYFPKGARAGDCIHAFFEQIDFNDPATFAPAAFRALQANPQPTRHGADDKDSKGAAREKNFSRWQAQLCQLANDVLATPLPLFGDARLCLNQLCPGQTLRELAFHLPAPSLNPARLVEHMAAANEPLPHLTAPALNGYLKGFIDLVFEYEGRYYVLDWKSNHLGWQLPDYAAPALTLAMQKHGYYLQARLYLLALHRYLRVRLPDYDPALHLGGACYLFIRGVRPNWSDSGNPAGFCWLPPNPDLLTQLELALEGK